ncbi:MAG: NfeD family protein [Cyanobium sp. M30B3]|nr:MAG: NfeD family protein [Cyanobium sp. M30B3]
MPAALIWLLLGLSLLLLELLGLEFDGLLAGAVAALLVSVLAAALPLPPLLQMAAFVLFTAVLLGALHRWGLRRERGLPPAHGGERATVISGFDGSREGGGEGRVRWQGQSWAATNLEEGRALHPGSTVTVLGREGIQLQVLPAPEEQVLQPPERAPE